MIRRAEGRDLPEMVRMAAQFVGEAHPDAPVDATYLDGSFRAMLASGSHLVLVLDVNGSARGVFCAVASRSPWSPVCAAIELGMWIDPAHRGGMAVLRMLRAYVSWAEGIGCIRASMTALPGRSLDRLYARCGFQPDEINYMRRI
tara:strand:+ start:185 stop:619 length:435 start_codon:yes stop_codon:yes gene_type:complete